MSLGFSTRVGIDSSLAHVVEELTWNLHESFFSKLRRIVFEVIERYKLNDISLAILSVSLRIESFVVSVEDIHIAKISVSDSDDDYRHGKA
jgi:hypothetical protein